IESGVDAGKVVLDEILAEDAPAEVRYRRAPRGEGHVRYVSRLVPEQLAEHQVPALPLRERGVYLLTGGLGGLGLIFADYLAAKCRPRLVLVGRSARSVRQEEHIRELERRGAEILHVQADISNPEDAQRVVREAKARFSTLHGVIHAAGVTRDAFILR